MNTPTNTTLFNPLVTLIRQHGVESINYAITHAEKKQKISINRFDLLLQVLLIACSYRPHQIWLGVPQDITITCELINRGDIREASAVLQYAIETKRIWLNTRLIYRIAKEQIVKLRLLQDRYKREIASHNNMAKILKPDAVLKSYKIIATYNSSMNNAIAIEKISGQTIMFKPISLQLSKIMSRVFHYLHAERKDDLLAFGAFLEGETFPFAFVSYARIDRMYKQHILQYSGINPNNSIELTRAWNAEQSPKNTMSLLFTYAHTHMQRQVSKKNFPKVQAILTAVNPNLGFTGSAFKAVGFGIVGHKPTKYFYTLERRSFITRRSLLDYQDKSKFITDLFPLLPTNELAVILDGTKRIKPVNPIYTVGEYEYLQ